MKLTAEQKQIAEALRDAQTSGRRALQEVNAGTHRSAIRCSIHDSLRAIDAALALLEAPANPMRGVWRCSSCGDMQDASDPRWRWNGEAWEHKCGDPQAGYFPARYFGQND